MQSEHLSSEPSGQPGFLNRSVHERFAIPHTFNPNLTVGEATLAAMGAFTRIFLGSVLFAVWGVASALLWNSIASHFWRVVITIPLVLLLLSMMAGLMLGIAAIGNLISPRVK
jgi:hypothetical protein